MPIPLLNLSDPESQRLAETLKLVIFDFDGVFTDNTVWVTEAGKESVRCCRSDGLGLSRLKALNLPCWVLSTEKNPVVSARCKKLGIPCIQGQWDKTHALLQLVEKEGVTLDEVMFVGNDINDIPCLTRVGFPVAVQDAYPEAVEAARYQTTRAGGFGAVREVCDVIVRCKASSGTLQPVMPVS